MNLEEFFTQCHKISSEHGFWDNDLTDREAACEKLLLVHCEISEAVEELRKTDNVHSPSFYEELADVMIRMADLIGRLGDPCEMEEIIKSKMEKNNKRPHKHGKKF